MRSIIEAHDDFGMMDPQGVYQIDVLANDQSSSNGLEILGIEASFGGQFVIDGSNSISFTPDSSFVGLASASYIVADNLGTTASANAFIQVMGNQLSSGTIDYLHVVTDPLLIILEGSGYSLSPDSELLFGELTQLAPFAYEYTLSLIHI